MKWSLRIGRFSGIDVRMHFTFLLLVGWFAMIYWRQGQSLAAAMAGVAFILAIFLCVILHEFGHALAARRYGIRTRDIILLPIGGVARLDFSRRDRVAVATVDPGPAILLDPDRVERNLVRYLELRGEIVRRTGPLESVDLRWQDRIAVVPASRQRRLKEDG